MSNTSQEFDAVIAKCRKLFSQKMSDYGSAWRILRLPSFTDQIFIKAQRIRNLQDSGVQKVADNIEGEFMGIINYSVMALIQIEKGIAQHPDLDVDEAVKYYDQVVKATKNPHGKQKSRLR